MNGSFAAARSASSCSLRTTSPTESRQSKVASAAVERSPLERTATPLLVAVRLTRSRLGDPSQVPGSSTGTPRASSSGIVSRRKSCTSSASSSASAGSADVEADAVLGQQRLDLGQLTREVASRVARAEEAEDLVALLVQKRGRQREGRVVLCVQPELEGECGPALVQVESELPRSRGATAEAVVQPAGQPPVERRIAGVARQLGLGGAQPVEEELERGRAAVPQRCAQPDASFLQAVARDLVDEDGVEVAHGRVAIAVEGGGGGLRERRCDPVERRLHALVERGAPERVPGACVVLEVRVDETLGHGALRELDDGEDRRCAPAGVLRSRLCEPDQLADVEAPGSRNRPVGVTGEEGRGRVLLPDQFEHDLAM